MITIKQGADVRRLRSEVWDALYKVDSVYRKFGKVLFITSGNDSKHSRGSFHYIDLAVDIRTRNLADASEIQLAHQMIKKELGIDYDVILESNHIHIEYDPRNNRRANT